MDYHFNEKMDIRLLALYTIDAFKMSITNQFVLDTVLVYPFVDFFEFQEALDDIEQKKLVVAHEENGLKLYSITDKGKETLDFFKSNIPLSVRERIRLSAKGKIRAMKNALNVSAVAEKVNEIEYASKLKISEGGYPIFELTFNVGDKGVAEDICKKFKKEPNEIYSKLISVLLEDK